MELITFLLFAGGRVLLTAIVIFLSSMVSGMGLGVGLHHIKKFFSWRAKRKVLSTQERASNPAYDIFSDIEQQAGAFTAKA